VARHRLSRWCRRSRRRLGPCSGPAPSLTRTAPSFLAATGPAPHIHSDAQQLRAGGGATLDLLLLGTARRRRHFSPPLTAHTQEKKETKTPMGLVAWAPGVSPPRICITAVREAMQKPCSAPGLTSQPAELAPASAAQAKPQESTTQGQMGKIPFQLVPTRPRAWRLGFSASRAGDRPIKRARAGAAG
jgi:hypothetical protein